MNHTLIAQNVFPVTQRYTPKADTDDRRFADIIRYLPEHDVSRPSIAIVGVPQHIGVERNGGRIGAAQGPDAIRTQLYKLTQSNGGEEIPAECRIIDVGNIRCDTDSLEEIHDRTELVVHTLLQIGAFVIVLGGGHDIAFANGVALARSAATIGIINIDAHPDVRPFVEMEGKYVRHSGSPFRQLLEHPSVHIPPGAFVEFGIQPFVSAAAHLRFVRDHGHHVMMLGDIRQQGCTAAFENAIAEASRAAAVYCSFDIDSVASAFAPGVSAPAADGFTIQEILHCADRIASEKRCSLVDIVEYNPLYDQDHRTAKLIATLVARLMWSRAIHS